MAVIVDDFRSMLSKCSIFCMGPGLGDVLMHVWRGAHGVSDIARAREMSVLALSSLGIRSQVEQLVGSDPRIDYVFLVASQGASDLLSHELGGLDLDNWCRKHNDWIVDTVPTVTQIVPAEQGIYLDEHEVSTHTVALEERIQGRPFIVLHPIVHANRGWTTIPFYAGLISDLLELGCVVGIAGMEEMDGDTRICPRNSGLIQLGHEFSRLYPDSIINLFSGSTIARTYAAGVLADVMIDETSGIGVLFGMLGKNGHISSRSTDTGEDLATWRINYNPAENMYAQYSQKSMTPRKLREIRADYVAYVRGRIGR